MLQMYLTWNGGNKMGTTHVTQYYKLVCIDVTEIGYFVVEDVNIKTLKEVHEYVKDNMHKHPHGIWKLLPFYREQEA